jgi:hypothetical protein
MNGVDTTVLLYVHDPRDPAKQEIAASLLHLSSSSRIDDDRPLQPDESVGLTRFRSQGYAHEDVCYA